MTDQMIRQLMQRLDRLERSSARVRVGEVTGTAPLDVSLGASDISYDDVRAVDGTTFVLGDQVAVLLWGHDLIVLGRII